MKTDVQKKENAEVEISVTLPNKDLEQYRSKVEGEFIKNYETDGFRKGKVPEDVARKAMNPLMILEQMAQEAISKVYVDILHKEDIKAIGHPEIMITKIAEGADLEFKITTAVLPEVKLSDYKKLAKAENAKEISSVPEDKEIEEAIMNLRKMRAQQEMAKNAKEGEAPTSWTDIKEEDLPELDDEWAKALGNSFENLEDFKKKIVENLAVEKEAKNKEKKRMEILEAILKDSEIEVPGLMTNYEIDKMMHEFEGNIAMTGMNFDEYLSSIEKTREDYKKEWQPQAYKRAQTQLMLNHIAAAEKIEAGDEEIQAEVTKIMEQYKDQKNIDENNVRAYVASVLTHQKVFEFLEKQGV